MPYTRGLHEVADRVWAWILPDGGYGWSNAQVAWTFSLAIGFLGLAAAASFAVYRYRQSQPAAILPSAWR